MVLNSSVQMNFGSGLIDILDHILYVLKTGIPWRYIRGTNINWNTIYKVFIKLNKYKVFELCYKDLLKKYISKSPNGKLRFILTDTSFIPNKAGRDFKGFNKYHNSKTGTKLSLITDSKGIPFNVAIYKGNKFDSIILRNHLSKNNLICKHKLDCYKKYFLDDKGYDSLKLRYKLQQLGYIPIIAHNKRGSKYNIKKLSYKDNKIYKKRTNRGRSIERLLR